jgi:glycosyltransferase involved in cell wall biosynthesis
VLIAIDSLQAGGAEKSMLDIIHHFSNNTEVTVVYFYAKHDLKASYEAAPCRLMYAGLDRGYHFSKGIRFLTQLIRNEKFDVIVTSLYRSGIICRVAGYLTGTPVVDTIVNDSYSNAKRGEFKGIHAIKFYAVKLLDRMTARIPVKWISNSSAIAATMSKALAIQPKRIEVIYRGREVRGMASWENRHNYSSFHFVAAGRLVAQKGFHDLIRAFKLVADQNPSCHLTIYGDGNQRKILDELVAQLDLNKLVSLPGRVPDVWEQFYKAHCFVLPSHYEGLSGVLIEAMITGIPIIASDIDMNKEAAVHPKSIHFYSTGNVDELANTMMWILQHYEEATANTLFTRDKATLQYDIMNIAQQYEAALRSVAKKPVA